MNIAIICPVRGASKAFIKNVQSYVDELEADGHDVHFPHRDTNQLVSGLEICRHNALNINCADEVHVFYTRESLGVHFDLGVAFLSAVLEGKPKVVLVENDQYDDGRSFARMLAEWLRYGDISIDGCMFLDEGLLNTIKREV